jgi:hypothetical protein
MGGLTGFVGAGIQFIHDPVWQWSAGIILLFGTLSIVDVLWEEIGFALRWPQRVFKRAVIRCIPPEILALDQKNRDVVLKVNRVEEQARLLSAAKDLPAQGKASEEKPTRRLSERNMAQEYLDNVNSEIEEAGRRFRDKFGF